MLADLASFVIDLEYASSIVALSKKMIKSIIKILKASEDRLTGILKMQSIGVSPSAENYSILTILQKLHAETSKYVNKQTKINLRTL